MSCARLRRPGWAGRAWRALYELGYGLFKAVVAMAVRPLLGVRVVGRRAPRTRGALVLCSNHASYLDPAFVQLAVRRRVVFVMTGDFYDRRGAGWFFRLVGAIPVGGGRRARRGLRRAMAHLRRGHAVGLFPEGRLTRDGTLGPARRGIAVMARRTGAPVLPLAVSGSRRVWPRGARRPRLADVRVAFGTPLRWRERPGTEVREAEEAFAREVMERIAALHRGLEEG